MGAGGEHADDARGASTRSGSPTVRDVGEFGLIDRLARVLAGAGADPLRPPAEGDIAIGDDAALWTPTTGAQEVLTTDALVEDVHFRRRTTSWEDLGWKALAQNVSDVAAMGARPRRAFVTLGLPPDTRVADLEALYAGMAELARAYELAVVGGDTVSSPVLFLSVSVVGELRGAGLRRGAGRPGDVLAVTGTLGGSRGGLEVLERGGPRPGDADEERLALVHRRPTPRVDAAHLLAEEGARCGMDLSDGLLGDAAKLAYASGLAATLRIDRVPMDPALERVFPDRAAELALAGGEDFELLVAAPSDVLDGCIARCLREGHRLTAVGELHAGEPGRVRVVDRDGNEVAVRGSSWDHFARRGGGA